MKDEKRTNPIKRKLFNAFINVETENMTTPYPLPKKYDLPEKELEIVVQKNYVRIKQHADRIMERLQ